MTKTQHTKWLHQQLPLWVEQQLIPKDSATQLKQLYPIEAKQTSRWVLSTLGIVIFSLGVILLFAYNWQDMHRLLKLACLFSAIIAAHGAALFFSQKILSIQAHATTASTTQHRDPFYNNKVRLSEGFALLGSLLFGAGIALISQIYHIDGHYPHAFALWGIMSLLMAWARQSKLQTLLALSLISVWGISQAINFGQPSFVAPLVLLCGLCPLAWQLHSKWLLSFSIIIAYTLGILMVLQQVEEIVVYIVLALSIHLISLGFLSSHLKLLKRQHLRHSLSIPGFFIYFTLLFFGTFAHFNDHKGFSLPLQNETQLWYYWLSAGVIIASLSAAHTFIKKSPDNLTEHSHCFLLLLSSLIFWTVGPGWLTEQREAWVSVMMNLVYIGHCLLFILNGSQHQRGWEVAFGCLAFAALVFARYLDLFDSLLSRSLVFLLLGAGLFVVGNFYSKQTKAREAAS